MESSPITIVANTSADWDDPISGVFTWDVAKASVADRKVKANINYDYYHY